MSNMMKFPSSGVFTTLNDGDVIEVTGVSYRLGFNYSGRGITPNMVNTWIADGELSLWYEEEFSSIVDRNNMGEVMAVVGDKDTSIYPKTGVTNTQQPQYTFVHASDFHGDVTRFRNVMDLARQLRADGALLTGDFTSDGQTTTGNEYVHEVLSEYDVPAVVCVGNHDTGVTNMDNQKVFDALISPLVASQGYESVSGTQADKTWFFRDFATQKLRVISLNLYETDHTQADRTFISQAQIDWFIATLASVPSGYGVMLAYHVSETLPTAIDGHDVWWNSISVPTGHTNAPIVKIIDAFIAKATLSMTFVSHGKSGVGDVTINVSADFTGVASNEFIAHFVGHTHVDCVGIAPDTAHRQIVMCVTCANPYALSAYKYLANGSVIPRGADSMTQDAINVVGIDRTNKRIGIARVGSRYRYATLDEMVGFRTSYV
jgi:3',5'-cyclic AMP phosphodiesterase CpdA